MDTKPTKVLCVNGSPRGAGNSAKMLRQLVTHVYEFGGEAETIHLARTELFNCEGCYSETRDGSKCVSPCKHKHDSTNSILEKIIAADALVLATPVYWAGASSLIHSLLEKMTSVENNRRQITQEIGHEPFMGKPCALLSSQEGDGSSMALSQMSWALNNMGFMVIPCGMIFKPAILNSLLVRTGLRVLQETKFECIDNWIRLAARNLVLLPQILKGYSPNDYKVSENRC